MTIVINFFGSPGTGKSTSASYSFAMSKDASYNSEYVQEKAKEWAWEKRHIDLIDQFELFKKQTDREKRLFHETELVFTDSPIWLCAYYASLSDASLVGRAVNELCETYYKKCAEAGVQHLFIWLTRVKPYNPKGRFQTESESDEIALDMKKFLAGKGLNLHLCRGVKEEVWDLVKTIIPEPRK